MTDEQIALARRAVACRGWKWMPGVLTDRGDRVVTVSRDNYTRMYDPNRFYTSATYNMTVLPDLTDPATLGCLLAMVREAWSMPMGITLSYSFGESLWNVVWEDSKHGGWCGRGKTEAEALVDALGSAP